MTIKKIKISNYRSIVKIEIAVDENNNFICFCGQNNVGKTNILNALSLFFDKSVYSPEKDCPNHKYYGTRGGSYQPKIEIDFIDGSDTYKITKDWNKKVSDKEESKLYKISGLKNKKKLEEKDIEKLLLKINFFFLPSINVSFPEAIKYIMNNDVIDLETEQTRMSGKKGEMKKKIEQVLTDLKSILSLLSNDISPLLNNYKGGWGVAFDLPTEVNTFRDLMIGEVDFYIKDKSNSKAIDAKGSGLQRLCHILMYFRIIEKLNDKKEKTIICIDEPDVYLHSGLQKKLLEDIRKKADKNQIFITTHSPIFIDTVKLSNVFLLDQKVEEKEYQRAKRKNSELKFNAIQTHLVDFNESSGISILKNYLGIIDKDNLLFDKYNILVEGEEDKIYLSKLLQHFNLNVPNIISCNGADNVPKYLDFYNSIAEDNSNINFLVLLDNDQKGREVKSKIKLENYKNLMIEIKFIISFSGFSPALTKEGNSNANIEIEDFLSPEIICYLCNKIFKKKNLKEFKKSDINTICTNIKKSAFQNNGILELLENKKNELNPDNGQSIKINRSDKSGFKSGIANIFNELDKDIINLIGLPTDDKNKYVFNFLKDISELRS
jgi:predicted ATP-dependent endonuclease of OLD family